ncbi:MAG: NnrU family protein [Gammaproteobacteria bacterium]|nr:NnrU family protein [Gammaproteobacteria bacterium]MDP2348410.1 NnrU family protein [Gammaproteobacteria bacterium]
MAVLILLLIPGLLIFMGLHLLREFGLRATLQQRLGVRRYKILFSLGIVISLIMIMEGKAGAPFVQLWVPPFNWRSLTHLLMISATILFVAGSLPHSYTREMVVHPMLIGVIVWGVSHLLSNGDLASMLIFVTLPIWAVVKIVSLERARKMQDSPSPKRHPGLQWDAAAIIVGMIAYSVLLVFHGHLFGFALIGPI